MENRRRTLVTTGSAPSADNVYPPSVFLAAPFPQHITSVPYVSFSNYGDLAYYKFLFLPSFYSHFLHSAEYATR